MPLNDDSCAIKLTLWGTYIDRVKSSGKYSLKNFNVRECPRGKNKITTVPFTEMLTSDEKHLPSKLSLKKLRLTQIMFMKQLIL